MKEHLINDKILFFLPFLLTFTLYIDEFNYIFSINGAYFEFFFYEVILLTVIVSVILLGFYFLLSRFIKDKRIIFINMFYLVFALRGLPIGIILFIVFLLFTIIYKKDNKTINIINEIYSALIALVIVFLGIMNIIPAINNGISFNKRISDYNGNKKIIVDKEKPSPNIYWFHMDGMPSTGFINNYYKEPLDDFNNKLSKMNFINNSDASFKGGHHTITAIPALLDPDYYDNYLNNYLKQLDVCALNNCKTNIIPSFKELNYRRIDNELVSGLKKKGYSIVSIIEYNQHEAFKSDYVYDISNINDKCRVPYFEGYQSSKKIYHDMVKIQLDLFLENYDLNYLKHHNIDKYLSCEKTNYTYINKNKILKETYTAMKDAKEKDNNPKFYFINNSLMHIYWNYDEEGNLIKEDNNDLKDYTKTYIYTTKILLEYINYINENDPNSIIVVQGDHGIHVLEEEKLIKKFKINKKEVQNIRNSTISLVYIPEELKTNDEEYLDNPLNISRYLINNYVGDNYEYIKEQ